MAKKTRSKKSASSTPDPVATLPPQDDEDVMDDLLAQLDTRDQTVQSESASVLNDMEVVKQAQSQDEETTRKKDPKQRFLARQVRLSFPPPCVPIH